MRRTPNEQAVRFAWIVAPLWFVAVACGGESTAATRMGDDASSPIDSGVDAAVDTGREAASEAASAPGAFYCASASAYAVGVKTVQGPDRSLGLSCDGLPFGPAASLVVGPSAGLSLSLCAMDANGAKLSLLGALPGPKEGMVTVKGTWSDGPADAVSPAQLDGIVDLTRLGSIGDLVEGAFSAASASSLGTSLTGTFHTCHQFDDAISRPPLVRPAPSDANEAFCADAGGYYIDVAGDGGTTRFASSCENATVDVGAVGAVGGPFSPHGTRTEQQILLEACSDRSEGAAKISIVGGTTGGVTVYLRDAAGKIYLAYNQPEMDAAALRIGPLGGAIEGTFAAMLKGDGSTDGPTISGSFRVCHLQDLSLVRTP